MWDESQLKTSHLVCQINLLSCFEKLILVPDSTVCCVCLFCQSFVCGRWTGSYWSAWLTSSWCPCHHQATHRSAINPSNVLVLQSASSGTLIAESLVSLLRFTFLTSVLMNWVFCWTFCVVAFLANRLQQTDTLLAKEKNIICVEERDPTVPVLHVVTDLKSLEMGILRASKWLGIDNYQRAGDHQ